MRRFRKPASFHARLSRNFTPEWTDAGGRATLEARALTAPLFFKTNLFPSAGAGFGTGITNTGDHAATAAGNVSQNNFIFGVVLQMTGSASASWVDAANPPSPALPVGTAGISGNTASQLSGNVTGPAFNQSLQVFATAGGTYVLADDAVPAESPVTLVESFQATYSPALGPSFTSNVLIGLQTSVGAMVIGGGAGGLGNVAMNNQIFNGTVSGVFTVGASTTAFSLTPSSFTFTITTVFPNGVPSATGANPPAGPALAFNMATIHTLNFVGGTGSNDLTSLTTHYDAHFYA